MVLSSGKPRVTRHLPCMLRGSMVLIFLIAPLSVSAPSSEAAQLGNKAKPLEPCCNITGINAQTGIVTASENATGRVFSFKVTNSTLLHSLKLGQAIYANFATKQASVNGISPCCSITALGNASTGTAVAKDARRGSPLTPCCAIVSISRFGPIDSLVTAQVTATGQTFQFKVTDAATANSLKVGQAIYANFATKQVSVNGIASCCSITALGNTSTETGIAPQSQPMAGQPPPSSGAEKNKPTAKKREDAGKNTFGTGATVVQPAEPTTEVANRGATAGGSITPNSSANVPIPTRAPTGPRLTNLECLPNQVALGSSIHCKVGLNGKVPGKPLLRSAGRSQAAQVVAQVAEVQVTTNPPAQAPAQTVAIGPGSDQAYFDIPTPPDAQAGPLTISATYQDVTLNSAVQLAPGVIKNTVYIYRGNPLNDSINNWVITGSFTLAQPLAANLLLAAIYPTSFSFTQGSWTWSNKNCFFPNAEFAFSTDAKANITAWYISLQFSDGDPPVLYLLQIASKPAGDGDEFCMGTTYNCDGLRAWNQAPGRWSTNQVERLP